MKNWSHFLGITFVLYIALALLAGCGETASAKSNELALNTEVLPSKTEAVAPKKPLSEEFKKYWYAGDAEITSYRLEQARYGEIREGKSVLIFVTEPFCPMFR